MKQSSSISVIILTFNNQATISGCLESIQKNNPGCEIIIIDNHSSDQTINKIKVSKNVQLIKRESNFGFAKSINYAVNQSSGEYLVILNPDSTLESDRGFDILVDQLKNNSNFGLTGPAFINPDGSTQLTVRNYPTLINALKEYILGITGSYDFYQPKCKDLCQVQTVVGACMVVSKKLFDQISGFDENYFLYYEDIDLCRNISKLGLKIGFYPKVIVKHQVGHSGKNLKVNNLLIQSAKKYHGFAEFYLIQLTLRISKIIGDRFKLIAILAVFSYWFLTLKLFSPTIFTSLTIINGINTIRGYGETAGMPYLLNWLLTNKIQIVLVGSVQWLSYFQPSLYFSGWIILFILPAFYGFFKIVSNEDRKLQKLLFFILVLALPGSLYYPDRVWTISLLGWLFMGILICYGIIKFIKR